ncbi:hypothetical protein [Metabacillus rhizolycopersici]|uniref:Lipoprotein n=1 Tax=Metabacillus rhizolycopersici TaxID=2875709 RepID=A0ABS7UTR7_9BACI|nr:hypothetical protein [Metabacillus rhizolycopersici]MBZ5751663.1 hypothetical protein [Metabacillus rhizolycopersici]
MQLKRLVVLIGFISILTLLTACSSKPSVELVNTSVDIINDKDKLGAIGITEGDKKGQELVPTALYYEFTIKNTGNKKIGDTGDKGLEIKIEPNDNLVVSSKEIIGFNIFNLSEYGESGLGYGYTFASILEPDQEGKYTLHFNLGVSEENPQVPFLVPSKEQLEKLNDDALDATLIVLLEDKEIARFDLRNK